MPKQGTYDTVLNAPNDTGLHPTHSQVLMMGDITVKPFSITPNDLIAFQFELTRPTGELIGYISLTQRANVEIVIAAHLVYSRQHVMFFGLEWTEEAAVSFLRWVGLDALAEIILMHRSVTAL